MSSYIEKLERHFRKGSGAPSHVAFVYPEPVEELGLAPPLKLWRHAVGLALVFFARIKSFSISPSSSSETLSEVNLLTESKSRGAENRTPATRPPAAYSTFKLHPVILSRTILSDILEIQRLAGLIFPFAIKYSTT